GGGGERQGGAGDVDEAVLDPPVGEAPIDGVGVVATEVEAEVHEDVLAFCRVQTRVEHGDCNPHGGDDLAVPGVVGGDRAIDRNRAVADLHREVSAQQGDTRCGH